MTNVSSDSSVKLENVVKVTIPSTLRTIDIQLFSTMTQLETIYLMKYEHEETKKIETLHGQDYGDGRYSTNGLDVQTTYFVKEDPCRVATVIYSIIQHPDLMDVFVKNFN